MKKVVSLFFTLFIVTFFAHAQVVTFSFDELKKQVRFDEYVSSVSLNKNDVSLSINCESFEDWLDEGIEGGIYNNGSSLEMYSVGDFSINITVPSGKFIQKIEFVSGAGMEEDYLRISSSFDKVVSNSSVIMENVNFDNVNVFFAEMEGTHVDEDYNYIDFEKVIVSFGTYAENVTLSDSKDYPYKGQIYAKNVSYTRTMNTLWGSLCLPFDYSIGKDARFDLYFLDTHNGSQFTFRKYARGTVIPAGNLVFVRRYTDTNTFSITANNVLLSDENFVDGISTIKRSDESQGLAFELKGNIKNYSMTGGFFFSGDLIYEASDYYMDFKPYRGWIVPLNNAAKVRLRNISFDEDLTAEDITAINELLGKAQESEVYSVNGSKIGAIQKGVNLVKTGSAIKKILVK